MSHKYTTILFDADNTLLDFDKDEHQALVRTLKDYGVPATDDNINTYVKINKSLWKKIETGEITKPILKRTRFKLFFDAIGFECDEDPLTVNEHYLSLLGEGGNTLPGAVELCKELKNEGYDLYIVTNGVAATQAKRLKKAELLPYFTEVFVSETVGYQKPRKEYFDYVLNTLKEKDTSRILLVGDSLSSDIQGAMNVGLPCCWLNLFGDTAGEKYKIDYVIDDIRKVTDML